MDSETFHGTRNYQLIDLYISSSCIPTTVLTVSSQNYVYFFFIGFHIYTQNSPIYVYTKIYSRFKIIYRMSVYLCLYRGSYSKFVVFFLFLIQLVEEFLTNYKYFCIAILNCSVQKKKSKRK